MPSAAPPRHRPHHHHHHHYHHRQDEPQHRHHDHHEHHQYLWWMDPDKNQPQKTIYILSITDYHNYMPLFPCACSQILMQRSAFAFARRILGIVFVVFFSFLIFLFFLYLLSILMHFVSFCSFFPYCCSCFSSCVCGPRILGNGTMECTECTGQQSHRLVGFLRPEIQRDQLTPKDSEGTQWGVCGKMAQRCATIATMTPIHIRKEVGFNLIRGSAPDFRLVWKFATQIWCTTVCCGWDFDPMGPWDCSAVL